MKETSPGEDLEHYEFGELLQYFGPTWWIWDEEPFDILPEAGVSLNEMYSNLNVRPNIIRQHKERIFEARYELPVFMGSLRYPEGIIAGDAVAFLDFVIGVPYGCIERIGVVGETTEVVIGVTDDSHSVPPLLDDLFKEKDDLIPIYNLLWLDYENTKSFAEALPVPLELEYHWWFRMNLIGYDDIHPVPGEFMSLVTFLFPNEAWGWQRSNPSLFSGNWMETVFYSSGIVLSKDGDGVYTVQYRKEEIRAIASDWTEYKVGDRATILKRVDNIAQSFTWEDLTEYDNFEWVLVPITFYEETL